MDNKKPTCLANSMISSTVVSSVRNSSISVTTSIQMGQVRSFFTLGWERVVVSRQKRRLRTSFMLFVVCN